MVRQFSYITNYVHINIFYDGIYNWFNKDEMQYVWDYLCHGNSANHYLEIS
jgi:hypothetical protein